jgi:hypothetical protein
MSTIFSYADQWFKGQRTISLHQITYGINSPGMAFKLSETESGNYIERSYRIIPGIEFVDNNGIRQLQFKQEPAEISKRYLELYYKDYK